MLKMSLAQVKQQRQEGDFETFQMKEIEWDLKGNEQIKNYQPEIYRNYYGGVHKW